MLTAPITEIISHERSRISYPSAICEITFADKSCDQQGRGRSQSDRVANTTAMAATT